MPFKPGKSGNPAGKKPGAKTTKTKVREDWRATNTPKILAVFARALEGKDIPALQWEAAKELRKAVLPDLRPIDADTGASTDFLVLMASAEGAQIVQEAAQGIAGGIGQTVDEIVAKLPEDIRETAREALLRDVED